MQQLFGIGDDRDFPYLARKAGLERTLMPLPEAHSCEAWSSRNQDHRRDEHFAVNGEPHYS
jgi:hypothetical protein